MKFITLTVRDKYGIEADHKWHTETIGSMYIRTIRYNPTIIDLGTRQIEVNEGYDAKDFERLLNND